MVGLVGEQAQLAGSWVFIKEGAQGSGKETREETQQRGSWVFSPREERQEEAWG